MKLKSVFALLSLGVVAAVLFSLNFSPLASTRTNAARAASVDVVNQVLFPFPTNVPAGGSVSSPTINLDGFENASVNVVITNVNDKVQRAIFFGPLPNGGLGLARSDTFEASNHLLTATPVHGPQLFVRVTNNGTSSTTVQGFVYAAR